ncbi:P-loop containing nucleoside triphosphate hydrolase protein [Sporormia fimetaria CBS 119925]|uniref:P-loop containing nucleoside triphosphate hydrolase protein n=1 Tax=Sporormia fimetaria CBS 119925 TaxID=1340428 RepID=A0A6A6VQX9_9PLEO|nr:P-loop containing nucleoside triphosphate hydrolase protein [Sporormia fimetaria CBS 119925]
MATTSFESKATSEHPDSIDHSKQNEHVRQVGWKLLFSFTTRRHIPLLFGALLVATIAAATQPANAVLFGLLFRKFADYGAGNISGAELLHKTSEYCIYLTAVCAVCLVASSLNCTLFMSFGELQVRSARERVFNALLGKNIEWYDTRENGIAAYLPSLQSQVRDLQLATSVPLGECVQTGVVAMSALAVALYFSWDLALVTLCTMPIIYLVMTFFGGRLSKHAHNHTESLEQALKYVTTAVANIETVKSFNADRVELQRYTDVIARAGALHRRIANFRSAQIGFVSFYTLSIFFQGFLYGSYLVRSGKSNPGDVVTTFWTSLMAMNAISQFLPQMVVLQKGKVAAERLRTTEARISGSDRNETTMRGIQPEGCTGRIKFKNVSFSYPTRPQELALRNVNITFEAGRTTFVVGRSGSGKSTLSQLLVRFYAPMDGQVLLDGMSLNILDLQWLRDNITLVEQHSVLFQGSIRDNIALGNRNGAPLQNDINEATDMAALQSVLKDLPDGLNTVVGPKGNSLSGGQRQRVALARARIRDTPILILDESTSALDYATRNRVVDSIRGWRKGKTTIIITHDVTQILPTDYVFVMDCAQVVDEGERSVLETQVDSPFRTFLTAETEASQESDNSTDAEIDDVISAYSNQWAPSPRASMISQLGANIITPFMSSGRTSFYRRSMMVTPDVPYVDLEKELTSRRSSLSSVDLEAGVENIGMRPLPTRIGSQREERRRSGMPLPRHGPRVRMPSHAAQSPSRTRSTHASPSSSSSASPALQQPPEEPTHTLPKRRARFLGRSRRSRETPSPAVVDSLSVVQILKTVWPNLDWHSRASLLFALCCTLLHAGVTPTFAYVFAQLLSTFFRAADAYQQALMYSLIILGIAIVDGLSCYGFQYLFDSCAQTWANNIKGEAMRRILLQPREFFDREENGISRIAECLDGFAEEARNLPGQFVGQTIVVVVMLIIAVVWALISCWKLTLVAFATVPIIFVVFKAYNAISSRWETRSNEADEQVGQVLHETFANIRTVRCLVLEEHFRTKYNVRTEAALKIGFKRAIYTGSVFGINFTAVFFVAALLFWFGAYLLSLPEFSVTAILQTFTILLLSCSHATFVVNCIPQIQIARDAGSRLLRLARLPITSHELIGTSQLHFVGDIVFKDTSFAYPTRPDHQVLRNVSMTIPQGSSVAIVGSSGSGKSTIASLLLKLYSTPNSGITISGRPISHLHTASLRSRVALVSQTPVLFPGSIAENIAYGLSPGSVTNGRIRAAAEAAGIAEFVESLSEGYRTVVGEGGTALSGGQAQRVAIARALVREPDVLVLDEATSALDVESAGVIRETVLKLVRGDVWIEDKEIKWRWSSGGKGKDAVRDGGRHMTVIIITHSKEMMAIAEHIVVLDKGTVVQEGGYGTLMRRRNGAFNRLLRGQSMAVESTPYRSWYREQLEKKRDEREGDQDGQGDGEKREFGEAF